ncbi:MAG: hypothetical protein MMC33_007481 [Icmadophila ericetorum]|nr:hypothetical protein [Icmadophila ericetorum]
MDDCIVKALPWDEGVLAKPEIQPALAVPKADRAIGWSTRVFEAVYPKATTHLGCKISPIPMVTDFAWPYCTIELKGETGSRRIACLQNAHNGAVMLSNLLSLRRYVGKEDDFFNKVHALSVQCTTETIELSCYWAIKPSNDDVKYYGRSVKIWMDSERPSSDSEYRESYKLDEGENSCMDSERYGKARNEVG